MKQVLLLWPAAMGYCSYERYSKSYVSLPRLLTIDIWQRNNLKCFKSLYFCVFPSEKRANTVARSPGRSEGCGSGCRLQPTVPAKGSNSPPSPLSCPGCPAEAWTWRVPATPQSPVDGTSLDHPDGGRTAPPGEGNVAPALVAGSPVMPHTVWSREATYSLARRGRQPSARWILNQFFRRMLQEIASWNLSLDFPLWIMWIVFTVTGSCRKHSSKGSLPEQGQFPQATCSFSIFYRYRTA